MDVHPLQWEQTDAKGLRHRASAFGIMTFYMVAGEPGDWTLTSPQKTAYADTPGYRTLAGAKAAAIVDYKRRVQACLVENGDK